MSKIFCTFRKLDGPRVDGGFVISFDVPEVLWNQIKDLPLYQGKNLVMELTINNDLERDIQPGDDENEDLESEE